LLGVELYLHSCIRYPFGIRITLGPDWNAKHPKAGHQSWWFPIDFGSPRVDTVTERHEAAQKLRNLIVTLDTSENTNESTEAVPPKRRNHALWLGPLLVFAGAVSYFLIFSTFPVLRDFPWVNLPIVLLGLFLSFLGLARAIKAPNLYKGKISGILGLLFSAAVASMFTTYIFWTTFQMPMASPQSLAITQLPDIHLTQSDGTETALTTFLGKKLVIVFYRGYW
jgi:hypothetical protein